MIFKRPLTGRQVLVMLIVFFGVIFAVNAVFITQAVSTFRGEEASRAYVRGMAYNDVLAERAGAAALGWHAAVNASGGVLLAAIEDADGNPVEGLTITGMLRHPADTSYDLPLSFTEREPGVYAARIDAAAPGSWRFSARTGGEPYFEFGRRLWLE